jgi:hypothetical protein
MKTELKFVGGKLTVRSIYLVQLIVMVFGTTQILLRIFSHALAGIFVDFETFVQNP